jgi:hypothetical protein
MSRSALRFLRVLGPLGAAAALSVGSLPALAQSTTTSSGACGSVDFQLANPDPGARVEVGTDVIQGVAMATNGASIGHIDFFLDNRDQGGINIGTAVPGMAAGPFGPGSFQTTVTVPNLVGGHDLFAYAYDTNGNQEGVISEPIAVGEDPSKAFVTPPDNSVTQTCGTAAAATTTTPPVTTTVTSSAPSTTPQPVSTTGTAAMANTVSIDVGNPSPGDTIHAGGYILQGVAFDKSAQSGSGIDRIEIFLDNRDEGGMFLGQATMGQNNMWTASVQLPNNQLGLHTLSFYAHSMVNDQETLVSVPVTVAP